MIPAQIMARAVAMRAALDIVKTIVTQHWQPPPTTCFCWVCREARAVGIRPGNMRRADRYGHVWVEPARNRPSPAAHSVYAQEWRPIAIRHHLLVRRPKAG